MNNQTNISLCLITKNEAENISKNFIWLDLCPAINEIIAVDDNSDDDTIKSITKLQTTTRTVKVFKRGLNNNFAAQRQFGVDKTTNDFVFWLDPDEHPSSELVELLNHIDTNQYNYSFKRLDNFLGKDLYHGETFSQHFLRLFNKNFGRFQGLVHEKWVSLKPVNQTNFILHHHSHSTLKQFLTKINLYSDIRAQELHLQGKTAGLLEIILYPKAKFIYNYFILLGFLDGTPGIIFALGMSFQSFLSKAKLWHLSSTPFTG
jgi:glycosyltransferase involved in cell wall biosynthesis